MFFSSRERHLAICHVFSNACHELRKQKNTERQKRITRVTFICLIELMLKTTINSFPTYPSGSSALKSERERNKQKRLVKD